jgi:FtsZ-binding cell division protein ZapB
VKEVISTAKSKIQELQKEIESLNQEYDSVTIEVQEAQAQRREIVDKNKVL